MSEQKTCAERIDAHRDSRIRHIAELQRLANLSELTLADVDSARDLDLTAEDVESINDQAYEALHELPLGVSAHTVFRVELSTGGPADWLEVTCTGHEIRRNAYTDDTTAWTEWEVERISYHFADWFDHAAVELEGADFETAEAFARSVVPELAE